MEISTKHAWEWDGGASSSFDRSPEPQALSWYALQLRPQFEKKADALLRSKGVETFLPLLQRIHLWSDRRKRVFMPLFSGYEFVHAQLSTEMRNRILRTDGVVSFVGTANGPTVVPSLQIDSLKRLMETDCECAIRPFLHVGQRVRIASGALRGIEGILSEDARNRLIVSVECIERSISVLIEGYDLEIA